MHRRFFAKPAPTEDLKPIRVGAGLADNLTMHRRFLAKPAPTEDLKPNPYQR